MGTLTELPKAQKRKSVDTPAVTLTGKVPTGRRRGDAGAGSWSPRSLDELWIEVKRELYRRNDVILDLLERVEIQERYTRKLLEAVKELMEKQDEKR